MKKKGYRLEDLENSKLITLCNVWFFEDETPSDLAVVEVNINHPSTDDIDELVDNAINSDQLTVTSTILRQSSDNVTPIAANDTSNYNILSSPPSIESSIEPPTITKPSKWANLPKRNLSNYIKNPVDQYEFNALDPDIIAIEGGWVFVASITAFAEPKTWSKAHQSLYSKQWKKAINTEYDNLVKNNVIKWVNKLPKNKSTVSEKIVYK